MNTPRAKSLLRATVLIVLIRMAVLAVLSFAAATAWAQPAAQSSPETPPTTQEDNDCLATDSFEIAGLDCIVCVPICAVDASGIACATCWVVCLASPV